MTDKNLPRGHVFDGIEEYDNDLPGWWVAMYLLTIVFSCAYVVWYHAGIFPSLSLAQHYESEMEETRLLAASTVTLPSPTGEASAQAAAGGSAAGKEVFATTCAPCHGAAGQGVVGPNLTDDFWINGATKADVERIITKGSLEKGMPAWGEVLGMTKVQQLVVYIFSIQGSNPAEAKPAQGAAGKLQ